MKPGHETMDRTLALLAAVDWSAPHARRSRTSLRTMLSAGVAAVVILSATGYWQYRTFVVRAEVAEAVALARGMEDALLEHMEGHEHVLPSTLEEARSVTGCAPPAPAGGDGTCAGEAVAGCFPAAVAGGTLRVDCRFRETSASGRGRSSDHGEETYTARIAIFARPTREERRAMALSVNKDVFGTALGEERGWMKGYWVGESRTLTGDEYHHLIFRCSEDIRIKYLPDDCRR